MAVKQWWSYYDKHPADAVAKLTNMMIEVLCALFPWRRLVGLPRMRGH